jgi:hypothetical protein
LFIGFVVPLVIAGMMIGCGPSMGYRQGEREEMWGRQSLRLTSFDKLWEERTISLGQGGGGLRIPFFSSPGGGEMSDRESFPLSVRATVVDSTLIEAGLREFARLAKMSDQELADFRARYSKAHDLGHNIYIWAELQTALAEEYLNLDRWAIFLEDEEKHQFEPVRVVEQPRERGVERRVVPTQAGSDEFPEGRFQGRFTRAKDVELYFPMSRLAGEPILSPAAKALKLVMLQADNPNVRAEGAWDPSTFKKN